MPGMLARFSSGGSTAHPGRYSNMLYLKLCITFFALFWKLKGPTSDVVSGILVNTQQQNWKLQLLITVLGFILLDTLIGALIGKSFLRRIKVKIVDTRYAKSILPLHKPETQERSLRTSPPSSPHPWVDNVVPARERAHTSPILVRRTPELRRASSWDVDTEMDPEIGEPNGGFIMHRACCQNCKKLFLPNFSSGGASYCTKDCSTMDAMKRDYISKKKMRNRALLAAAKEALRKASIAKDSDSHQNGPEINASVLLSAEDDIRSSVSGPTSDRLVGSKNRSLERNYRTTRLTEDSSCFTVTPPERLKFHPNSQPRALDFIRKNATCSAARRPGERSTDITNLDVGTILVAKRCYVDERKDSRRQRSGLADALLPNLT